jgi:hypothetical protein
VQEEKTKQLFEEGLAEFLHLVEVYWDGVQALLQEDKATVASA